MKPVKRIFVIGHSGAGKGVLAQALARKLGWKYLDADFALSTTLGRELPDLLGKPGEEALLRTLSEVLTYQKSLNEIVVTTDDSLVCSENNRRLLASEFTVYLKVSLDIQLQRISFNRPLLPTMDYKAFLGKQHRERDAWYEQAACFSLSSDDGAIDEHVLKIIGAMES